MFANLHSLQNISVFIKYIWVSNSKQDIPTDYKWIVIDHFIADLVILLQSVLAPRSSVVSGFDEYKGLEVLSWILTIETIEKNGDHFNHLSWSNKNVDINQIKPQERSKLMSLQFIPHSLNGLLPRFYLQQKSTLSSEEFP